MHEASKVNEGSPYHDGCINVRIPQLGVMLHVLNVENESSVFVLSTTGFFGFFQQHSH